MRRSFDELLLARTPIRPAAGRALRAAAGLIACATVATCGGETVEPQPVATVVVSPGTATVASRAPLPLSATARSASGRVIGGIALAWSSADTSIARVSATGLVSAGAVLDGAARPVQITAQAAGIQGSATVTVLPVPVATVTTSPPTASLEVGGTQAFAALLADATPLTLTGRAVTWMSSDTSVATVDATGAVLARPWTGGTVRTATITATSEGKSGSSVVSVTPLAVATVTVGSDSVAVGDTRLLERSLLAGNGLALTGRAIAWSSSDPTIATVNAAGLAIPAQRWDGIVRTVTITATSEGVTGQATLTVLPAPVGSITLDPPAGTLPSGGTDTIAATTRSIAGVVLDGRAVSWSSSDPAVLAVSAEGILHAGTVTGGAAVPVQITATSEGFSQSATFQVLPSPVVAVQLPSDTMSLFPRQSRQLTVSLTDASGATLTGRPVVWATSDPSVVTVSASGLVSAPIYLGSDIRTALVTATSEGHADVIEVTVEPTRVVNVTLQPNRLLMPAGTSQLVHAVLRDALGDELHDRAITWSSSDEAVATVTDSGRIAIVGPGTATIVANADGAIGTVAVSLLQETIVPASLAPGGWQHCGLTAAGAAYCWGYNAYGQLGNGTLSDPPGASPVSGGIVFSTLSSGGLHSCGISVAGDAYCWGSNSYGQLGDGTANSHLTPTPVAGGHKFTHIATGLFHTCAIAVGGAPYCWGRNNVGQNGDGTLDDRHAPSLVEGGLVLASIQIKNGHTCGLTPAGEAWCWGRNLYGALGDSSTTHRSAPVPMRGGRTFTQLVVGWDHTCGLAANGVVECLGRNQFGQLGDGTFINRLGFGPVVAIPTTRAMFSGFYHMCVIGDDDRSYCWGRDHLGELGDFARTDRSSAIEIAPDDRFESIGGGYGHACAVATTGVIQCWGTLVGGALGEAPPPARRTRAGGG